MEKIRELFAKYKEQILYVFFGGLTTLINWGAYALCYNVLGVSNVPSVIIAWILGVAFAFVTNKIWVFESRSFDTKTVMRELWTFVAARLATGLLDLGIMYLAVDVLGGNGNVWKLISNVIVIILNYVFSKCSKESRHKNRAEDHLILRLKFYCWLALYLSSSACMRAWGLSSLSREWSWLRVAIMKDMYLLISASMNHSFWRSSEGR